MWLLLTTNSLTRSPAWTLTASGLLFPIFCHLILPLLDLLISHGPNLAAGSLPLNRAQLEAQSDFWSNIWSMESMKSYSSRRAKWTEFCNAYRRNQTDFSPRNVIDYITYLGTTAKRGEPMKWNSIQGYTSHLGTVATLVTGSEDANPMRHPLVSLFLKGVRRTLAEPPHKAEPCSLQHLKKLSRLAWTAELDSDLALELASVALIASLALWGCLRLGSLLPKSNQSKALLWKDVDIRPEGLVLSIRHSKSIQFRERVKVIHLPPRTDLETCPVFAARYWISLWQRRFSRFGSAMAFLRVGGTLSRSTFLNHLKSFSAPLPPLTGHSFRRGFVLLALLDGVPIDRIMLHGDWRSMEVALSYAEDLLLPNPLNINRARPDFTNDSNISQIWGRLHR